ncbi:Endoglucanase EG-II [Cladobotryum mycophilum]|uniref:cellulase n=1 Tax=Cladobotryum mycophilum TaxID=491253 RepID=A0ABR0SKB2_9HYPO
MRTNSGLLSLLTLASGASAALKYLGVAIPGIDFGCDIDGSCPLKGIAIPLDGYGGGDGEGQMKHFTQNDGMNIFRLPATWQFLVNNKLGKLDKTNFEAYDALVQACLNTGAYCMLDVHNFGRYNGGIVGQGGPSNDVFADLWTQIATTYAKEDRIVFGLMNEPHDLDINLWAQTCQAAVTAIRKAGAKTQAILLPGTNFASAETYVASGSAAALANVTNPDGSTDNLLLDIHKYLDINNSGTHVECTTNNVEAFKSIATWLKANKRQAMVSETGASMEDSCMINFCAQNKFIADNSDVFVGFVGWGAGSFDQTYILTLTPTGKPGAYVDNKLMKQCILDQFKVDLTPTPVTTSKPSHTATADADTTTKQVLKEGSTSTIVSHPTKPVAASSAPSSADHNAGGRIEPIAGGFIMAGLGFLLTVLRVL